MNNYKHCCVVDSDGNYKTFVLVTQREDMNTHEMIDHIEHYTLQEGESVFEINPPTFKVYANSVGYVKPVLVDGAWTEGATQEEMDSFNEANPAPEVVATVDPIAQLRADVDYIALINDIEL